VPGSIGLHRALAAEARATSGGSADDDAARARDVSGPPCQLTLL